MTGPYGRPPVEDQARRTRQVSTYLTLEEHERLQALIQARGYRGNSEALRIAIEMLINTNLPLTK
jgi:Arc/MetJ-type ribon-helix-helix transcriptional regulator